VRDLLEILFPRQDVLLALGTGNLERGARIKLEPGRLNDYFSFGGFGSDAEARVEVLRAAVTRAEERTGHLYRARDVFVIGDTVLDMKAGRAIGATTVAVASGHGEEGLLLASGPDIFMKSFLEAEGFLDSLEDREPELA
jgi:phosphoglycolate phosphatase-like HAD superfamily hydrolase